MVTSQNHGKSKNYGKRSLLIEILAMLHAGWIWFPLFPLAAELLKAQGYTGFVLFGLTYPLSVALSYLMIRKFRKLFLYVLGSLLILLAYAGLAVSFAASEKWYVTAALLGLLIFINASIFIIRAASRIAQSQIQQDFEASHEGARNVLMEAWEVRSILNTPAPQQWIITAILYMAGVIVGYPRFIRLMIPLIIADILVCFCYFYMNAFTDYVRDHYRVANMPLSTMGRVHRSLMYVAFLLIAVVLLPAILYGREPLQGYRPKPVDRPPVEMELGVGEAAGSDGSMEGLAALAENEDGWQMPEWVSKVIAAFLYGITAIAGFFVIRAIILHILEIGRDFSREDQDEVIFLDEAAEEAIRSLYGGRKERESMLSPNARIRRRYKKRIRKGASHLPGQWATPQELEEAVSWNEAEERIRLHELYEKARYSREGCSSEDLKDL